MGKGREKSAMKRNGNEALRAISLDPLFLSMVFVGMLLLSGCASTLDRAAYHYSRGNDQYDKGQYDQAISDYTEAIKINPNLAGAYNNRGLTYSHDKGDYDRAISDFSKAIEINPRNADAYVNRANAYTQGKGQYDLAIADYTKAIEIAPRLAMAYYNRGISYEGKGEYDQAVADFSKAIELDPTNAEPYSNRGVVYMVKLGNRKKACSDWKRACELGDCRNYNLAKGRGDCK